MALLLKSEIESEKNKKNHKIGLLNTDIELKYYLNILKNKDYMKLRTTVLCSA